MSDQDPTLPPGALRLRADPPRVMRLSRKALALLGGAAALVIGAAVVFALHAKAPPKPEAQTDTTAAHATPDGLAAMPKDYGQIPKLGPPLPGDLGKPILNAQQRGADGAPTPGSAPSTAGTAADAARQQAAQTRQAARTSRLFTSNGPGAGAALPSASPATPALPTLAGLEGAGASAGAPAAAQDTGGQASKRAFLAGAGGLAPTTASGRLTPPVSPYVVQAGSIIPAALITGLRSDLPGQVTAQVTQNVYDTPTGRFLLIPQGARLIGEYDASVAFGQSRVLLVWTRLIQPGGASISLDRQPGADGQGFAGLQDRTDFHWGAIAKATLLSTLLGVGADLGQGADSDLVRALRQGTQDTLNQTGQQLVRRQLDIQPTLTIRPGFPLNVDVTRDLILDPISEIR